MEVKKPRLLFSALGASPKRPITQPVVGGGMTWRSPNESGNITNVATTSVSHLKPGIAENENMM
jgi:hypothetical protein